MEICKDCRWWRSIEEQEAGMGVCTMLGTLDTHQPIRLYLSHGRGSAVVTGELFGCNQFEAKT